MNMFVTLFFSKFGFIEYSETELSSIIDQKIQEKKNFYKIHIYFMIFIQEHFVNMDPGVRGA
jgi:hypothetical protein